MAAFYTPTKTFFCLDNVLVLDRTNPDPRQPERPSANLTWSRRARDAQNEFAIFYLLYQFCSYNSNLALVLMDYKFRRRYSIYNIFK